MWITLLGILFILIGITLLNYRQVKQFSCQAWQGESDADLY